MADVNDIIFAVASDNLVDANKAFNAVIQDKINSALDDTKIQLAQSMLLTPDDESE
jgi:hypothetical protein